MTRSFSSFTQRVKCKLVNSTVNEIKFGRINKISIGKAQEGIKATGKLR